MAPAMPSIFYTLKKKQTKNTSVFEGGTAYSRRLINVLFMLLGQAVIRNDFCEVSLLVFTFLKAQLHAPLTNSDSLVCDLQPDFFFFLHLFLFLFLPACAYDEH